MPASKNIILHSILEYTYLGETQPVKYIAIMLEKPATTKSKIPKLTNKINDKTIRQEIINLLFLKLGFLIFSSTIKSLELLKRFKFFLLASIKIVSPNFISISETF